MENIKKNPLSLQLNAEDFLPASNEEKQSLVVMRESVNFWKDGIRRLKKNKIAMVSFVFIIAIAIFAYLLPAVWPYSYSEQMKGSNNLKPFEYSASEQARIDAGEKVFPHILGTDRMGRDFAVRIMMGTRVSLSVGLIASVLVLIIGATYGAVAAFAGGWVDNIMMRITDILYTIPDILLIILLGMALIRYIRRVQKESFTARERMRSFRRLSSTPRQASSTEFLRAAGNFIESYIPPSKQNEEMKTILQLRDDRAFKPSGSSDELPHAERQHMLQAIKKAIAKLPVLIMAAVLTLSVAGAAGNAAETDNLGVQAYEQGEYAKAIDYFSRESNDTDLSKSERAYASFGIGNSYYRMNKPGLAALNYRRALELSPYFTEARYNLQFVERKEGAILPANTTENQWLTYISHDALGPISILSGAVMLTFLALLTVTRRHGALLTILATLSGLVTVAAIMNYIMYPETPESIPADRLLVVTQKTPGRHAADMNSPAVITLPESTPLILRAERGSWYYASTFQNTPVWIPRTDAQPL